MHTSHELLNILERMHAELGFHLEVQIDLESDTNKSSWICRIKDASGKKIGFYRDYDLLIAVNGAMLKSLNINVEEVKAKP